MTAPRPRAFRHHERGGSRAAADEGWASGVVESVAVIGGSIAGCAAALVLHRAGARRVVVHERATAELADRGVGVAVHTERCAELLAA